MSSISLKKLGTALYQVKISLKENEINDAEQKALRRINVQKSLKGFRKGKAPEHLIRSHFSVEIEKESAMQIIHSLFDKINNLLESSIHQIISLDWSKKAFLKVTLDCKPYVKLCKLKKVVLYDDKIDVSDDTIDQIIKTFQNQIAIEGERKEKVNSSYKKGDLIVISVETIIDGVPTGKLDQNIHILLGNDPKNKILDDYVLEKQPLIKTPFILEKKINEGGSSKSCAQVISIHAAYELTYPPIDDHFPKLVIGKFDNINAFREYLREQKSELDRDMMLHQQAIHALTVITEKSEIIISQNCLDESFQQYGQHIDDKNQWNEEQLDQYRKNFENEIYRHLVKENLIQLVCEAQNDQKSQKPSAFNETEKEIMLLNFLRDQGVYRKGLKKPLREIFEKRFSLIL